MGRISYEETLKLGKGEWPFKSLKTFVFTRRKFKDGKEITFVNENLIQMIENLRRKSGKDIWLFGGGSFIKTMRDNDLVDEYVITTVPVFLGNGIRLFQEGNVENKLKLITIDRTKDIVQSHYRIIR